MIIDSFIRRLVALAVAVIGLVIVVGVFQASIPFLDDIGKTLEPGSGLQIFENNPYAFLSRTVLSFFIPAMIIGIGAMALMFWRDK